MENIVKQTLISFEKILKKSSLINVSKGKYNALNMKGSKDKNIVYDIEGLNYENFYIPYIKIIFMLNSDFTEFSENRVLVSGGNDYTAYDLDINTIFNNIKNDKFIQKYSDFVVNGLSKINKITKDPFTALEQTMDENGIRPIDNKFSFFKLSKIDREYNFNISVYNGITVEIEGNKKTVNSFDDIFIFLVKIIDKI